MSKVILKRSSVSGKVPLTSDLEYGELAINYADGIAYFKKSDNTIGILSSSNGGSQVSVNNRYTYTATSGQQTFAAEYDAGMIDVYLNGVKQVLSSDFTAINGSSIQFVEPLAIGDIVDIISYTGTNNLPDLPNTTIVGSADSQTLTNKTIDYTNNTLIGIQPTSEKGQPGGYASLDSSGLVPSIQLPSYVDDVLEYANQATFPSIGFSGKIYVAIDTNKTYRWSGSAYIEISASPGTTDALVEGSTNLYFTQSRVRGSISATQNLSYNSATGVFTGPDLSGYQLLDADLTAIAGIAATSGLLKKTAANTWSLDTNTYLTGITSLQVTNALGFTPYNSTNPSGYTTNTGTVTSVGLSVPTGLTVTGSPITTSGTLAITLTSGYSIPTTASQTNWNTAYTDRNKWDGGATGLVAATGRTSLGLGTAATMAGPSGTIVGTTDTQTLTNKTFTGYTETVYNLTGNSITATNGTIQYKTLTGNTVLTEALADGQCVTLMINPGTFTVTWPSITWIGSVASTAPTLIASVYNCITLFQFDSVVYGKYEGRV